MKRFRRGNRTYNQCQSPRGTRHQSTATRSGEVERDTPLCGKSPPSASARGRTTYVARRRVVRLSSRVGDEVRRTVLAVRAAGPLVLPARTRCAERIGEVGGVAAGAEGPHSAVSARVDLHALIHGACDSDAELKIAGYHGSWKRKGTGEGHYLDNDSIWAV